MAWLDLLEKARKALAGAREVILATDEIQGMPGQPRTHFDPDSIERLSVSMQSVGQIQPGIVRIARGAGRKAKYELIDGERRWRAAQKRKLRYRALLVEIDDASVSFLVAATANFNREAHTPLEVSDSIARMVALDMPQREVARVLGLHETWVGQLYGLQQLSKPVRALMDPTLPRDDRLPVSAAVQIAKVAEGSLQLQLAKRVLARKVTLGGLRAEVVRVAKATGAPVRERELKPSDRWRSLTRRAKWLSTQVRDLETLLGPADQVQADFANRPAPELREVCDALRLGADSCSRLAATIEAVLPRRRVS